MKTWTYNDPIFDSAGELIGDEEVTMTEDEIMELYFPYWSARMKEIGKTDKISRENCINDFIVCNWCYRK